LVEPIEADDRTGQQDEREPPPAVEALIAGRRWVLPPLLDLPAGSKLACPA
jgi:hypothetical protein